IGYTPDVRRSEKLSRTIGRALRDGYRDKIKIAVTLPSRNIKSTDDLGDYLNRQLEWLGTEKADFCMLGWLDRQIWPGLQEISVPGWGESVLSDGRAGSLGFCFHDDYQTLWNILDARDRWVLCQVVFNYMDVDHHPGIGGIRYAAERGLAVVASEPLKGGRLIRKLPDPVTEIWGDSLKERSLAEWALRWVWHYPEVATVISDVSSLEQLQEHINLAETVSEDTLSVPEQILVNRARDAYRALKPVNCTACRGCMPCPRDVDFPRIFELYNDAVIYDDVEIPRGVFREEGHDIGACNECGVCEERCGRNVPVLKWLKEARRLFQD
ncbi:MAG: aldo/keto reductase, partial [Dehalococcoidia bacterium]